MHPDDMDAPDGPFQVPSVSVAPTQPTQAAQPCTTAAAPAVEAARLAVQASNRHP